MFFLNKATSINELYYLRILEGQVTDVSVYVEKITCSQEWLTLGQRRNKESLIRSPFDPNYGYRLQDSFPEKKTKTEESSL